MKIRKVVLVGLSVFLIFIMLGSRNINVVSARNVVNKVIEMNYIVIGEPEEMNHFVNIDTIEEYSEDNNNDDTEEITMYYFMFSGHKIQCNCFIRVINIIHSVREFME